MFYTSTLDAALRAKAWHLPAGATFLDRCQTLQANKETLGERQPRAGTGLALARQLCAASYPSTNPSLCPLRAPGVFF